MHRRVRNVFVESGLTAGYIVQSLSWNDTSYAQAGSKCLC
ncbi:phage tail termination protein [Klebsiella pneumoniae]